jgi:predicted molibdopterin-dependent oxidoreductase YjgC
MRIQNHPIFGKIKETEKVRIKVDGKEIDAVRGEPVAAALMANGIRTFRYTKKYNEPRGIFCALGRCTDCLMIVNGVPNTRTCVTCVENGMEVETQHGLGVVK